MPDESENEGAPGLEKYERAILRFLNWLEACHGGKIYTPDPWSPNGMSDDHMLPEERVRQFLEDGPI